MVDEAVDGADGACLYQGEAFVRGWPWYRALFDRLAILAKVEEYMGVSEIRRKNERQLSAMYRALWGVIALMLEKQ